VEVPAGAAPAWHLPRVVTRGFWMLRIGQSLVCTEEMRPSDVILVENFDPHYTRLRTRRGILQSGLGCTSPRPYEACVILREPIPCRKALRS